MATGLFINPLGQFVKLRFHTEGRGSILIRNVSYLKRNSVSNQMESRL